ncbi:divergent polysaccharide deacetylase family protein [Pseudomonadales bacterium]|nr:divergent polysaccharide deacetylase family protein [Pseudomonadales bacterium]MDB4090325.1 divergent polysaccharide deacetylase family protein [Pseudomonadales bacterium]MDB4363015.1 divergent polysaccharide deacetylase family protein [Pseudomonadales bacterium]
MPRRGLSWGVQYLWGGIAFLYLACAQAQNNQHENTTVISPASSGARLAIIIDDIGYNLPLGQRAIDLPGAITYAILPHTPVAERLARKAISSRSNKEIIVHMPMESQLGNKLGPGGLVAGLDKTEFLAAVRSALEHVPHARGLSNHMGSYLTTLPSQMHWLMTELARQGYYYIDSKTVTNGQASAAAINSQVPYIARDIFLDHDPAPAAIQAAFNKAKRMARQDGIAVVIAHPYRSTLDFLEQQLPVLSRQGYTLVRASEAINYRQAAKQLALQ